LQSENSTIRPISSIFLAAVPQLLAAVWTLAHSFQQHNPTRITLNGRKTFIRTPTKRPDERGMDPDGKNQKSL
jgi:hypothetical protein